MAGVVSVERGPGISDLSRVRSGLWFLIQREKEISWTTISYESSQGTSSRI